MLAAQKRACVKASAQAEAVRCRFATGTSRDLPRQGLCLRYERVALWVLDRFDPKIDVELGPANMPAVRSLGSRKSRRSWQA
jgi:hypothetical protein